MHGDILSNGANRVDVVSFWLSLKTKTATL